MSFSISVSLYQATGLLSGILGSPFLFTKHAPAPVKHLSHSLSRAINGYIYNQDSVSCGFSFCPLGVKSMCGLTGEHVGKCDWILLDSQVGHM